MAKGMNLDEFRNALSSDATIENETLQKEIRQLRDITSEQIKELTEEKETYKDQCRALGNRCFMFTQGSMCLNCNIESCEHLPSREDVMAAVEYMIKNNMPRNEETRERVDNFLLRRKSK
jgi:hypothetical protein